MPEDRGENQAARSQDQSRDIESIWSLAAFWLTAFIGAALAAAVLLAPSWEERQSLFARLDAMDDQCRRIDQRNEHLRRVIEALKHDPEFNAELARYEFGYSPLGEERLAAGGPGWKGSLQEENVRKPWHSTELDERIVRLLAHDSLLRKTALITAAVFVIVGIACFRSEN